MAGEPGPSGKEMRSGTASGFSVDTIGQMPCSHGPPTESRLGIGGGLGRIFPNDIIRCRGSDACITSDSCELVPFRVR